MKYVSLVAVASAMVLLVGCASAPRVAVVDPVGPAPTGLSQATGEGSLVIYSAAKPAYEVTRPELWGWVFDANESQPAYEPAHSGYTIYSRDGKVLKHVRNARDEMDDMPTEVALPAGSYTVEAEGINCDSTRVNVQMVVVIKPGQTTVAHLQGGWTPESLSGKAAELAKLPCGRPIGWRAEQPGLASVQ